MIKLNVHFSEKDEAKALGARWNPELRSWTIEDDQDPGPFARWLPKAPRINVRASAFSVARGQCSCWKCNKETDVFGILIDAGSRELDNGNDYEEWEELEDGYMLFNIKYLSGDLENRIGALTGNKFRRDFSKTVGKGYLMNHCQHCDVKIGDNGIFNDFEGPFFWHSGLDIIKTFNEDLDADSGLSMGAFDSRAED